MSIYIESLLIKNLLINFLILYVVGKITRSKISKIKLSISAILGAAYTLLVFLPEFHFMGKFIIKFSISVLMIILAYHPESFQEFIKQISAFYLVSFIFAGAIIGIFYILNNNPYLIRFSFKDSRELSLYLIIGISLGALLLFSIIKYYRSRISRDHFLTSLVIGLGGKEANLVALIDTGNFLKEPITQKPVIIVEYSAVENILPRSIRNMYLSKQELDLNIVGQVMKEVGDDMYLRLIPFKSIGSDSGILIGFKPDLIKVYLEDTVIKIGDETIVAIYNGKLTVDEGYSGLLHPEILD